MSFIVFTIVCLLLFVCVITIVNINCKPIKDKQLRKIDKHSTVQAEKDMYMAMKNILIINRVQTKLKVYFLNYI